MCCVANKGMFAPENVFWVNSEEKKREKKRERERETWFKVSFETYPSRKLLSN